MRGLLLLGCSLSLVRSIAAQGIDAAGTKASLLMADRGLMRLVRARCASRKALSAGRASKVRW